MTQETINQVLKFRDDRNWKQFHNPKDLALSISLEAAELLEIFQWSGSDTVCESKKDRIKEELADVLNYCILMADVCGLDMDEIIQEKIKNNNEKYPVEKAKDSAKKYNELQNSDRNHYMTPPTSSATLLLQGGEPNYGLPDIRLVKNNRSQLSD